MVHDSPFDIVTTDPVGSEVIVNACEEPRVTVAQPCKSIAPAINVAEIFFIIFSVLVVLIFGSR